jgi:hypothetical protein
VSLQSRRYSKPKAENNEAKKSVHIPEHCQAQNFKLLENVDLPDHNSYVILHLHNSVTKHNLLIMDKDITTLTESRKMFKENAMHNIFGLHSKATLEFLLETFIGSK